jgi:predicted phosphodiesterase
VREPWSRERAQSLCDLIDSLGGNLKAACAQFGVSEDAATGAVRRHLNRRLGDVVGAAKFGRPQETREPVVPVAPPVDVSEPLLDGLDWRGARPQSTSAVERRLVVSDLHIPFHHKSALACFYTIARAIQPHEIIVLGDLINNGGFSRHDPYSPEPERYDLAILAARSFLRSCKKASPGSKIRIVLGNHDCWSERWISANPWAQGATFDLEVQLGIKAAADDDRQPEHADVMLYKRPEEEPLILGPVAYAHGNGGGMHFAKRYAETLAPRVGVKHLRVGHHHTAQFFRARNGCECWGVPWLGDERAPAFHYAPPPRGWFLGCLIDDVAGEHVTTTPIRIENGAALVLGRLIAAAA